MILKDVHKDVERYLNEDCYCIGEIYESNGFFCWIFSPSDNCQILIKNSNKTAVLCQNRIVILEYDSNTILDAILVSAINENNLKEVADYVNDKKSIMNLTNEESGIDDILSMVDAIMN